MNGGNADADAAEGSTSGSGAKKVSFRKVTVGESSLWETKRIQPDLNRVHLRTIEAVLDPTVSAEQIIGGKNYVYDRYADCTSVGCATVSQR